MKCPVCGADTHVVETRAWGDFVAKRRRACTGPVEHRVWTFEVSELIYRRVSFHAASNRAQSGGRLGKVARNANVVRTYQRLGSYAATARQFGLAAPTVRRIVLRAQPHA